MSHPSFTDGRLFDAYSEAGKIPVCSTINKNDTNAKFVNIGGDIEINPYNEPEYSFLAMEFINTTNHYLRMQYKDTFSKYTTYRWQHCVSGNSELWHIIPPGEIFNVVFYGNRKKIEDAVGDTLTLELFLQNRFSQSYLEQVELKIISYNTNKEVSMPHVSLISQNYRVKCISQASENVS